MPAYVRVCPRAPPHRQITRPDARVSERRVCIAVERDRTSTGITPLEPESSASANSATTAGVESIAGKGCFSLNAQHESLPPHLAPSPRFAPLKPAIDLHRRGSVQRIAGLWRSARFMAAAGLTQFSSPSSVSSADGANFFAAASGIASRLSSTRWRISANSAGFSRKNCFAFSRP